MGRRTAATGVWLPPGGCSHRGAPPIVVVAKSAQLRFRLRRKLRPLPCSSSPHRAGRGGDPVYVLDKKRMRRARWKRKNRLGALRCSGPPRGGGRRIGACSDFALPSGTLYSSTRLILPSRGGWCGGRRGGHRIELLLFSLPLAWRLTGTGISHHDRRGSA